MSFEERLTDIFQRYEETHIVNQAMHQAIPSLALSIKHTQDRLDPYSPSILSNGLLVEQTNESLPIQIIPS